MIVIYVPVVGIRCLWAGPYLKNVFGATGTSIGLVKLVMGVAMALGNFIFGPIDRLFPSREAVVTIGNVAVVLSIALLVLFLDHSHSCRLFC